MVIYKEDMIENMVEANCVPIEGGIAIWVNGVQCGYITYGIVKNHMEIRDLYVKESVRGKGYAKQLMRYVLSTEGLKEVRLCPHSSFRMGEQCYLNNEALVAFFSNFRFGELGNLKIIPRL